MAKILILEDDKLLLKVYRTNFGIMGYEIEAAGDGEEGLEKIKQGGYDVILMDLRLPKLSGLQILSFVQNENLGDRNGPIIMLSNVTDEETKQEALRLGAAAYLSKDKMTPQSVVKEVEKYIS